MVTIVGDAHTIHIVTVEVVTAVVKLFETIR